MMPWAAPALTPAEQQRMKDDANNAAIARIADTVLKPGEQFITDCPTSPPGCVRSDAPPFYHSYGPSDKRRLRYVHVFVGAEEASEN